MQVTHFIVELLVDVKLTSIFFFFFFKSEAMNFRLGPGNDKEPVNSCSLFIDSRKGESMKRLNKTLMK